MAVWLRITFPFLVLLASSAGAAAEKPQKWVEVRAPHFTVVSNGSEKQARRVARHFEMIRAVFQQTFPATRLDPAAPLVVLAAKDELSLKSLLPEYWEKKGGLHPAGVFVRGPEKNYVALRMDITGEDSYHIIYHEYFHLITSLNFAALPMWLNEGLAEFYGTAVIRDENVDLGRPDENHIRLLRQGSLMPLEVLFAVDRSSPHYNESSKAGVFYAQSWALTHFLMLGDKAGHVPQLQMFLKLISSGKNGREAATQAFGDLPALEAAFRNYLSGLTMPFVKSPAPPGVDEKSFTFRAISPAESSALRGDFMLHTRRNTEARALLEEALRLDPQLAQTHESMGFLHSERKEYTEATKWFEQAVKLDSRSYLAHYYYAAMNLRQRVQSEDANRIEASLRSAIAINPGFAPAYDALAAYYGMRGENLEEAHKLSLQALQLEPGNARFRITIANLFIRRGRPDDAVRVLEMASPMAKSEEESQAIQRLLAQVRQVQLRWAAAKELEEQARAQEEEFKKRTEASREVIAEQEKPGEAEPVPPAGRAAPLSPPGNSKAGWAAGKIVAVSCKSSPAMELTLKGTLTSLRLHAADYFKLDFTSKTWTPPDAFNPCQDLEGHTAAVTFRTFEKSAYDGEIVSVEVRK